MRCRFYLMIVLWATAFLGVPGASEGDGPALGGKGDSPVFVERKLGQSPAVTNSIGMKLVLIPAGEFWMGSPASDTTAGREEKPRHRVRITRPFYPLHIWSCQRYRSCRIEAIDIMPDLTYHY